jgi:hypothetical protein
MLEAVAGRAQPIPGERLHFGAGRLRQDVAVTFRRIFLRKTPDCPGKVQIFPIAIPRNNRP